jgi:ribosomal protein S18 acetylase RimI-like enzyme
MKIRDASADDIGDIARLFDSYRQFYGVAPDLETAKKFILERFQNEESKIFVAEGDDGVISGFVQLYPSFCSVSATKIYILYDLFVQPIARSLGLGPKLMNRASEYAREQGASRLDLMTAHDNHHAQHVYEKLGYKKVMENFYRYSLAL